MIRIIEVGKYRRLLVIGIFGGRRMCGSHLKFGFEFSIISTIMSGSAIELGQEPPEAVAVPEPEVNVDGYGRLAGDVLGAVRFSPGWQRIQGLIADEQSSRDLVAATEASLAELPSYRAQILRLKYSLSTPGSPGLSYQELVPYFGYTAGTVGKMVKSAVRSLRIQDRLDPINRVVYPERY
ncbi:MAG: hypothetical protein AAB520_04410, partial [Patescibacteria group bacterium]